MQLVILGEAARLTGSGILTQVGDGSYGRIARNAHGAG